MLGRYAPIKTPAGDTFQDLVALKGKETIGDDINKGSSEPSPKATSSQKCPISTTRAIGDWKIRSEL